MKLNTYTGAGIGSDLAQPVGGHLLPLWEGPVQPSLMPEILSFCHVLLSGFSERVGPVHDGAVFPRKHGVLVLRNLFRD